MIPKNVYDLCRSGASVTAELAKDPTLSPHEAAKKLFHYDIEDEKVSKKVTLGEETDEDLEQALACGNWGTSNPTRLFLRVSHVPHSPSSHDHPIFIDYSDLSRCFVYSGKESLGRRLLALADGE